MRSIFLPAGTLMACAGLLVGVSFTLAGPQSGLIPQIKWPIHDRARPAPPVITPGTASTQEQAGKAPSDAVVLFDGKDLDNWKSAKGGPAKWTVGDGYFATTPGTGDIESKQPFGDCQLHVEWTSPNPPHGEDQDRGNSGVYLMGLYEVQVLDSYHSKT